MFVRLGALHKEFSDAVQKLSEENETSDGTQKSIKLKYFGDGGGFNLTKRVKEMNEKIDYYDISNVIVQKSLYLEIKGYLDIIKDFPESEDVEKLRKRIEDITDPIPPIN